MIHFFRMKAKGFGFAGRLNIGLFFPGDITILILMDTETLSVDMSQSRVQEQAAVQAQEMSLDRAKEQAAAVDTLISSAQSITDPNLGQTVNLLD
jgi:hypothetical protein